MYSTIIRGFNSSKSSFFKPKVAQMSEEFIEKALEVIKGAGENDILKAEKPPIVSKGTPRGMRSKASGNEYFKSLAS